MKSLNLKFCFLLFLVFAPHMIPAKHVVYGGQKSPQKRLTAQEGKPLRAQTLTSRASKVGVSQVYIPGYTFYQRIDSGGGDITQLQGKTVDQIAAYCTNEPSCVAFNTNGWIKKTIAAYSRWWKFGSSANEGMYVKNRPPAGYIFYQGLDSNGGDITQLPGKTVDQLAAYCDSELSCVAFNTNGWVKKTISAQSQWAKSSNNANEGMYVKNPLSGYAFYQGLDSGGGDITQLPGRTASQLAAYCNKDPSCVAFNTNGWVKKAISPQSQWSKSSKNANEGIYVKIETPSGYTFYQGLDSNGGDITQLGVKSVDQLAAFCNKEQTCLAFNTNGWMKKAVTSHSVWSRWSNNGNEGIYIKNPP